MSKTYFDGLRAAYDLAESAERRRIGLYSLAQEILALIQAAEREGAPKPARDKTDAWDFSERAPVIEQVAPGKFEVKPKSEQASAPVESGWRPIESAPKDGTPILVAWQGDSISTIWHSDSRVTVAHWKADHPAPHWQALPANFMHILHPTHWQPIPAAPASEQEGGE